MAYTVLARRYRSKNFDEVVGQEAIARTLLNAIDQGRIAHAYLFVGTRGVGKTSTARIFAKALAGGTPEADAAIMTGQDTDVIEIDAASNSKVEETRQLIANAIYRPLRGKKKVYIIDEVHMLSSASFNALLKTLEEPPEHVVFILCTTESQKVPATIQSRCQRFEFRSLNSSEIAKHLAHVMDEEDQKAEPAALHAVAKLGNGSMRDALSLLDRLVAAVPPKGKVTLKLLEELLGLPDRQLVAELVDAIADGETRTALERADTLLRRGLALDQLLDALVQHLRDLLILLTCGKESELVDLADDHRSLAWEQSSRFDGAQLVHMIALIEGAHRIVRNSSTPRAMVDALIVRLSLTDRIADVTALLAATQGGAGQQVEHAPAPRPRPAPAAEEKPVKKR